MAPRQVGAVRRGATPARLRPMAARMGGGLPGVELDRVGAAVVMRFGTPHPGAWIDAFRADVVRLVGRYRAAAQTVVLTGARLFEATAGAELPDFNDLLGALAGPGAMVVAAIPGEAMGPGLELALACHGRVAARGARFGFPGIAMGVLPVNGGVARLAGLVDGAAALEVIGFGEVVPAAAALRIGLVDVLTEGDLETRAAAWVPPVRLVPPRPDLAALRLGVRRRAPGQAAPRAALQAIELGRTLPLSRGLVEIRRLALALRDGEQGVALRHTALCRAVGYSTEARDRLRRGVLREAIHLVDDGAAPQAVDLALRGFGFGTPPLAAADRDGIDVVVRTCVDTRSDAWDVYSPTLDLMLDAGRTGRAAGRGWYRYEAGRCQPLPDAALNGLLAESARAGQRRRRAVGAAEIVARCLGAARAMARRLRAEGVAGAAIDAMSLDLGFPHWRGGVWFHARQAGAVAG